MKTCYLFDVDLIERHGHLQFPKVPNHALLKMTAYFKQKGYKVRLVWNEKLIPKVYDPNNLYIASCLLGQNRIRFKRRMKAVKGYKALKLEHIRLGTPLNHCPITDIPGLRCDYSEYDKAWATGKLRMEYYPVNVGLMTRGCKRGCKFCVNRNRREIKRLDHLEDIYVKKGEMIRLLDDNLFASDYAVECFNEIAEFHKTHPNVRIQFECGIDARALPDNKLEALKGCLAPIEVLYVAWDDIKNSFLFKNIEKLSRTIKGTNTVLKCYILYGDFVYTEDDLYKSLLGFFYRYHMLVRIGVTPAIQYFEDDRMKYKNPYPEIYNIIQRQYSFLKKGYQQGLYERLPPGAVRVADEIKEILGDFGFVTDKRIDVLNRPTFNEDFKKIAEEIGIKHYDVPEMYLKPIEV